MADEIGAKSLTLSEVWKIIRHRQEGITPDQPHGFETNPGSLSLVG
jgi:hypothetical protein